MSLREQIEAAKTEGSRIRNDLKRAKTEAERRARADAKKAAKEILRRLPKRIAEKEEKGMQPRISVCGVGTARNLDVLRGDLSNPGHYVVLALEEEGYKPYIDLDCSGNFKVNHSLMLKY